MIHSDDLYGLMEVDDDPRIALDTKTLADREVMPLASTYPTRVPQQILYLPTENFEHWRFLRVERIATLGSE
jgi:hypothetical protein